MDRLKLKIKSNLVNFVRLPIDDGIGPDNWLLLSHLWSFFKMILIKDEIENNEQFS